jgi:hypothetical protein
MPRLSAPAVLPVTTSKSTLQTLIIPGWKQASLIMALASCSFIGSVMDLASGGNSARPRARVGKPLIRVDLRNTPSAAKNQTRDLLSRRGSQEDVRRTEGSDFVRFTAHLVDFACVKLLGIDHLSGVLLDND